MKRERKTEEVGAHRLGCEVHAAALELGRRGLEHRQGLGGVTSRAERPRAGELAADGVGGLGRDVQRRGLAVILRGGGPARALLLLDPRRIFSARGANKAAAAGLTSSAFMACATRSSCSARSCQSRTETAVLAVEPCPERVDI